MMEIRMTTSKKRSDGVARKGPVFFSIKLSW
jgi:hypothetical protein